jgi:TonB family protein
MEFSKKFNIYRLGMVALATAVTAVACNISEDRSNNTSATDSISAHKKAAASIVMTEKVAGATAPEFPGGQRALDNYVNDHIQYPKDAIHNDVTGIVRVSFTVEENGRITKVKLVNPEKLGDGLDEEAVRVVSNMPHWKPATLNGRGIKTQLELPISFMVET